MQALLERFIVSRYQAQLFNNKNIDILAEKLNWDRQTVLEYFTKVLAQKRYLCMQAQVNKSASAMEELRKNPESYLSKIDFDLFDD